MSKRVSAGARRAGKNAQSKRVTSYDVAVFAGVSQSAVSRAYREGASISDEVREKVYAASAELGYRPNVMARSLTSKRSNLIGIVMGDFTNPFFPRLQALFLDQLHQAEQKAIVLMAPRGKSADDLVPMLLDYQIDGLVITTSMLSKKVVQQCTDIGVPVVLFNHSLKGTHSCSICCDNDDAARQVAELFIARGFSAIGCIAGWNSSPSRDREVAFNEALVAAGLEPPVRAMGDYSYEGGYEAALELAGKGTFPEALFCINDNMAMGAMDAVRYRLGLKIPDDVSIVGFDDIVEVAKPVYDLTTMRTPVERMVQRAINNLLESQDDKPMAVTEILPAELIMRGTVRAGS